MVKEFNREYSSIKENSRLNQAGLPKVLITIEIFTFELEDTNFFIQMTMQDMHRHIAAGNDKYRYVMTRHSGILSYLRNNKKVIYIF